MPSASALPWLWVIEALANFKQVDASVLIDLVKRTPEISDDLGKNAREMVSLRILESFVAKQSANAKDVSSGAYSKIELDVSQHCEDVVRRIINEVSSSNPRMVEQEAFKWDLRTFIMHKRSCLPKCSLQQLKDAIVEGNYPILTSLKKMSGLSVGRQPEYRIAEGDFDLNAVEERLDRSCRNGQILVAGKNTTYPDPKKAHGFSQEDSSIGRRNLDLLPSFKDSSDLDTGNQPVKSHGDNTGVDTGYDPCVHIAKRLKNDATCSSQALGQTSVTKIGNELSEDFFRGNGLQSPCTVREVSGLAQTSQMGGLEESRVLSGGHDQLIAKRALGRMNEVDAVGLQHNHLQISHINNKVPCGMYKDGPYSDLHVNETEDHSDNYSERGISTVLCADGHHQIISDSEAKDKCEKTNTNTSNGGPDEASDGVEPNGGEEASNDSDGYQDEKIDVARKKCSFLSSQCKLSQETLATVDGVEFKLCMKCNKSGQLLACGASACPIVVHQTCLGFEPIFDGSGDFYCPFCAYSRAISEYLEVKKKASSARKHLAAFLGLENGCWANKVSKRSIRLENNQLKQQDHVNRETQAQHNGDYCNETARTQCRKNVKDKPQVEPSASYENGNIPSPVEYETRCARVEDGREGEKIDLECQSTSALEGQEIEGRAGCVLTDSNLPCRDTETLHMTRRQAEDDTWKEDLQRPINDPSEAAVCRPNSDAEDSSEEEKDQAASNYMIRFRKQEKQYTYPAIPQLRRRKLPWTAVEVEKLKEGVKRFSNGNDRKFPWKKILDFGSDVFQKGRTTIDLKDKWRNICKGSPKSK